MDGCHRGGLGLLMDLRLDGSDLCAERYDEVFTLKRGVDLVWHRREVAGEMDVQSRIGRSNNWRK